jgi:hypothetical protein
MIIQFYLIAFEVPNKEFSGYAGVHTRSHGERGIRMKLESILYLVILVLGAVVAIAPWTFAPVCTMPTMICWNTRTVETVLGGAIAVLSLAGLYRSMAQ